MTWSGGVYAMIVRLGLPRRRRANRAPIFCFHNVVEAAVPSDRSLHIPLRDFREYLDWIRSCFEVVPVRELVSRVERGESVGGLAGLTFDDAYEGVFALAAPLLRRHSIPATVFAVTGLKEDERCFWWDLAGAAGMLTDDVRRRGIVELRGDRGAVLRELGLSGPPAPAHPFRAASWDEIASAGDVLDIGSHSHRHLNLAALAPHELEADLRQSFSYLLERDAATEPLLSYPFGEVSAGVLSAAESVGFTGGVTLSPRALRTGAQPLALPRINVPTGISLAALECRASDISLRRGGPRQP